MYSYAYLNSVLNFSILPVQSQYLPELHAYPKTIFPNDFLPSLVSSNVLFVKDLVFCWLQHIYQSSSLKMRLLFVLKQVIMYQGLH